MNNTIFPANAVVLVVDESSNIVFAADACLLRLTEDMPYDLGNAYVLPIIPLSTYEAINASRCWCCGRGD